MKKTILALMCLAIASCKISEIDFIKPPQSPGEGKLVYQRNINIENLENVSLITYTPQSSYHLNISSQTLTIIQASCENTITLSKLETTTFLNTLNQIRICNFVDRHPVDSCTSILPEANYNLWYYYRNAIDPDFLRVTIPNWCSSQGLCSQHDIETVLRLFDDHKDALACP